MHPVRRSWLWVGVVALGCGSPPATVQVASLTDSPASPPAAPVVGIGPRAATTAAAGSNDSSLHAEPRVGSATPTGRDGKPVIYSVRKAVTPALPAIPPVLLSASHQKLCKVNVGDSFPGVRLPRLAGDNSTLESLRGKQATVVLFWHPDRWMARTALIDMQRDVASKFDAEKVAVVGIPVRQPAGAVQAALTKAQATFSQLLDTEGKAFDTVGSEALPRIYVLDPAGTIVWFDIEYSEGTRRELSQTLKVLTEMP